MGEGIYEARNERKENNKSNLEGEAGIYRGPGGNSELLWGMELIRNRSQSMYSFYC